MRLRNVTLIVALMVGLFSAPVAAHSATTLSPLVSAPEVVVREFYKWYIHSVSHQLDPFKTDRTTLKKYVTLRLIQRLDRIAKQMASGGYDGDPFLEAQRDYPDSANLEDEWLKEMSTSKVAVKGATASVTISFGENGALAQERVNLIQEGGVWKIDSVKSVVRP